MIDRVASLLVLIAAMIVPTDFVAFFQLREVQLISAILVVIITILYDAISGLLLGLTLITIYYRLHWRYVTYAGSKEDTSIRMGGPMVSLVRQYITPQHLEDAQNNIVNVDDAKVELVGVKGVYGEDVYGAQGMHRTMPGLAPEIGSAL